MKKLLLALLLFIVIFIAFLAFQTVIFKSRQLHIPVIPKVEISDSAKVHLSRAIQIKTISPENPADFDSVQFYKFREFLRNTYPLTQQKLAPKTINEFSLLYKWQGSDASLKPAILMGHLDVV